MKRSPADPWGVTQPRRDEVQRVVPRRYGSGGACTHTQCFVCPVVLPNTDDGVVEGSEVDLQTVVQVPACRVFRARLHRT